MPSTNRTTTPDFGGGATTRNNRLCSGSSSTTRRRRFWLLLVVSMVFLCSSIQYIRNAASVVSIEESSSSPHHVHNHNHQFGHSSKNDEQDSSPRDDGGRDEGYDSSIDADVPPVIDVPFNNTDTDIDTDMETKNSDMDTDTNKTMILPADPTTTKSWCPQCLFSGRISCDARKSFLMNRYGMNRSATEKLIIEQSTTSSIKGSKCLEKVVHLKPKISIAATATAGATTHPNNNDRSSTPPPPVPTFSIDPLRGEEGRWVRDKEFALQNSFLERVQATEFGLNETTDEAALFANSTLWRWEDANSPVTTISRSGFCQVCYHLDVTRLFIIGDSLSQQFRVALEGLLGYVHPQRKSDQLFRQIVYREFQIQCSDVEGTPPHFKGVTIKFERMNWLDTITPVTAGPTPPFVESNPNNTAIVFNIGAHLRNFVEYKEGFDKLFAWVQSFNVTSHSKLIPFFRETLPGHPSCEPFDPFPGDIFSAKEKLEIFQAYKTEPYKDYDSYLRSTQEMLKRELSKGNLTNWKWFDFKHANGTVEGYNAYSKVIIDNIPSNMLQVHWLNVYKSTVLRRDAHRIFRPSQWDCLHYLHPGPVEWWVHFFYSALLDLAGLEEVHAHAQTAS